MGFGNFLKQIFSTPAPKETPSETVYSVIDVETPNSRNDRVLSIAFTRMQENRILWTKSSLVNPEKRLSDRNIALTGIKPEDVADAPTFPQIWAEWGNEILDGIFVAHNARFDLSVLHKCCAAYGIELPPIQYIDTLSVAKNAMANLPAYGLDDLCETFRIQLDHHKAESDCRACAELLQKFKKSGIRVNDYACVFTQEDVIQSAPKDPSRYINKPAQNLNEKTKSINALLSLLEDVSADGKVTEDEVHKLRAWMTDHMELKGNFPFDQIYNCVEKALQDERLDPEELQEILETCLYLIDPVQHEPCCGDIDLNGKNVCISGVFDYGSEDEVTEMLTQCGATVKPRVVSSLNYLVVGNCGCQAWSSGHYGNKVKQVVEWRFKGKDIRIIREEDLMKVVQK